MSRTKLPRPLEGITVVALEQVIAAPFATRQLAELGARVIKIERPGGGDAARSYDRTVKGLSSHFVWTNRSKESLSLDAKHPEAKQILCRLIERADVFVQNLAPGAAATLDITMFEALGEWMGFPSYFTAYGGAPPPRCGAYHATIVPYGPFPTGDGGTVFLSVQNEREFARFCEGVLGNKALADDVRFSSGPARLQHRDALHAEIARAFAKMDLQEVIDRLEAADIANARLNTMREFWRHPQLAARERWARVGSPAGELDALEPPFNLDGLEPRMDPIPAVGEHTRAVLGELGYTAAEIDRLAADGAV